MVALKISLVTWVAKSQYDGNFTMVVSFLATCPKYGKYLTYAVKLVGVYGCEFLNTIGKKLHILHIYSRYTKCKNPVVLCEGQRSFDVDEWKFENLLYMINWKWKLKISSYLVCVFTLLISTNLLFSVGSIVSWGQMR